MQSRKYFTVLVVDDEPPICELLTRIAKKQFPEAQFVNTRSAEETLEYLNDPLNKWPSLVLLDIDLQQVISGLDFLPQLRAVLDKKVPIVMFTSSYNKSDIVQAYGEGATAYTQKPDDIQGWQNYVAMLKTYWYDINSLPPPPSLGQRDN